ncbi:hypothetical protein L210DRAFT_3184490 [Boletus edulis BED1]|uniref:Uncharacterized protein n=1 Tax=Boletus edulis BED1 TaxID=1328754 RepID=A0AAD4G7T2_BOLED|nr:hypothetical protein L210DRAFT_3184490 [Boletus edulis BED1]
MCPRRPGCMSHVPTVTVITNNVETLQLQLEETCLGSIIFPGHSEKYVFIATASKVYVTKLKRSSRVATSTLAYSTFANSSAPTLISRFTTTVWMTPGPPFVCSWRHAPKPMSSLITSYPCAPHLSLLPPQDKDGDGDKAPLMPPPPGGRRGGQPRRASTAQKRDNGGDLCAPPLHAAAITKRRRRRVHPLLTPPPPPPPWEEEGGDTAMRAPRALRCHHRTPTRRAATW